MLLLPLARRAAIAIRRGCLRPTRRAEGRTREKFGSEREGIDRLLLRGVTTAATAGSSEFSPPAPPAPPVPPVPCACAACPPSDAWLDEKEVRPSDPERRCGVAD